jgi:predicted anti-sigma-YlaC factor YlaD
MTHDIHEQARELLALGLELTDAQQKTLRDHLAACAPCQSFADAVGQTATALRSSPLAADARLVRATQMRVRFHAARLRETRERMWLVGMACAGVGISAAVSAPLVWKLFGWMGASTGMARPVWQAGFVVLGIVPVLAVAVLLLARGTHLANHSGR